MASSRLVAFLYLRAFYANGINKYTKKHYQNFGQKKFLHITHQGGCTNKKEPIMVDPKRVVSYEDVLKGIDQPRKIIIDVRNPDEVQNTGKIPSSINIPLGNVQDVLASMSEDDFKKNYSRPKPAESDELIFYCQSGRRSSQALDKALQLGYSNSKTYMGSWTDWSSRQK